MRIRDRPPGPEKAQAAEIVLFPSPRDALGFSKDQGVGMKLYRIDKLARLGGAIIKRKHILAASNRAAVERAEESDDCPICDVTHNGEKVGQVI
jgi:hypothetical protein